MRDEVTGMGGGLRVRGGCGGLMERQEVKGARKGRKVVLLEGSEVEGNKIRGIIKARGWNLTGEQTRRC